MNTSPRPGGAASIRKIVLHLNVGPEVEGGAQSLATYLRGVGAGYHEIVDNRTFVQCAQPDQVVWGAAGMNDHGYHICVIGNVQTAQEWHDSYSSGELSVAALRVAARCHDFGIPPALLTDAQIADPNVRGVCDHWGVNRAIVKPAVARGDRSMGPGDHTDVGRGFPWVEFMAQVVKDYNPNGPGPSPAPVPKPAVWKVQPMHKPPIVLAPCVADLRCPTGGAWTLHADGGVAAWGGAPFHGSPHGQPLSPGEEWADLVLPRKPGEGPNYVALTTAGDTYNY